MERFLVCPEDGIQTERQSIWEARCARAGAPVKWNVIKT